MTDRETCVELFLNVTQQRIMKHGSLYSVKQIPHYERSLWSCLFALRPGRSCIVCLTRGHNSLGCAVYCMTARTQRLRCWLNSSDLWSWVNLKRDHTKQWGERGGGPSGCVLNIQWTPLPHVNSSLQERAGLTGALSSEDADDFLLLFFCERSFLKTNIKYEDLKVHFDMCNVFLFPLEVGDLSCWAEEGAR